MNAKFTVSARIDGATHEFTVFAPNAQLAAAKVLAKYRRAHIVSAAPTEAAQASA